MDDIQVWYRAPMVEGFHHLGTPPFVAPCFWPLPHLLGGGIDKIFTSTTTWQDAQDHRRVSEKARRVLPLTSLPGDEHVQ